MKSFLCRSLLLLCLVPLLDAWAVTYTFNTSGNPIVSGSPSICSGTWSRSGGASNAVFTCSGNISTGSGDVLTVSSANNISVVANGSISLTATTVGTTARNISLRSAGNITTTTNSTINGSLTSDGGTITLTGTSVSGDVSGRNGVTTNGSQIAGTLTAETGAINLTGGSVEGLVRSGCCQVTSNGTNLLGGARSDQSGISITGGTLQGAFFAANNPAQFNGVTLLSGSVSGASSVTFSNSNLGSGNLPVTVTSVSGPVTLTDTNAFGDFTAPNWSTINVNGASTVIGTCLPNSTPANACRAPVVPTCLADNFNRSTLGNDWAVTSRNGSFGVPRIVSNRLRLTDNSGNVATGATVQRLVPAAGNLVQIEFKYYAYAGNGADGVAVIFSDAAVTPQPGGYGGSLGYAQLNGVSGFSGGWLGIALDEFGNFSNPTETRVGGPGARADSVSIRGSGSGTTGYRYLRGTAANLNPGIDISGTTAGPGHTYRIILDSRITGRTQVSVERNTGAGFVQLIAPFDAQAEAGQATLPQNFFVTFTGSTGGSNNVHELDDLSFCADRLDAIGQQIDHFRFEYSGDAVTCNPQPVTVRACLDSACTALFTDPVSVTLAPNSGWTATAPATVTNGNVLTFSGGVASAQLRSGAVGTVTLGVTGSVPATKPLSVPVCSTANCRITYADSGFIFDVPTLISARPQANIPLRAVRSSNNAQACVPGFANVTRTLQFTSAYVDPGSGTQPVVVNGTSVGTSPTGVSLAFDNTGSAPLTVRYDDAGQMRLTATYSGSAATGDSGLNMTGTDPFLAKPYGLCLETDSTCTAAGVSGACPAFPARAGDNFPLRIRAVGWQVDGEALTAEALCVGNITTPNFRLAGIALASQLVAPVPGSAGTLEPAAYSHLLGTQTTVTSRLSEVGVFRLAATPPAYFAESIGGGSSALVGRIIPASLDVQGSAALQPACGTFSYQEQPVEFVQPPTLLITGRNRQGAVTSNYDRDPFWRLTPPALSLLPTSETGRPGLDGRITAQGALSLTQVDATPGDGARAFAWSGRRILYSSASQPSADDTPVAILARQTFSAAELTDQDGACHGGTTCQPYSFTFSGSELRLGRLSLGNAHGSELQGLSLPLRIESWRDGTFQVETGDTCSAPLLGNPAPDAGTFTGNLSAGETTASRSGPSAGVGQILMSAPGAGNDGSVQVELPGLPAWLLYDWNGTGRQSPRGLASFGIYQGSPPLIFRRELYR